MGHSKLGEGTQRKDKLDNAASEDNDWCFGNVYKENELTLRPRLIESRH